LTIVQKTLPIGSLSPYQIKWSIKGPAQGKALVHEFNDQKGQGKVFIFDFVDNDRGELHTTLFNE
jgi:replication factor A1